MAKCDTCGNEYDGTFEVRTDEKVYVFDSIECAAHALAPQCDHCGCRILGHGVQVGESIYCCRHCSESAGRVGIRDRVELSAAELA